MKIYVYIFDDNIKLVDNIIILDNNKTIVQKEDWILFTEFKSSWTTIPKELELSDLKKLENENVIFISDYMQGRGMDLVKQLLNKNNDNWFALISSSYKISDNENEYYDLLKHENFIGWHVRDKIVKDYGFKKIWDAINTCKEKDKIEKKCFDNINYNIRNSLISTKNRIINLLLPLAIDIQGLSEVKNDDNIPKKYWEAIKISTGNFYKLWTDYNEIIKELNEFMDKIPDVKKLEEFLKLLDKKETTVEVLIEQNYLNPDNGFFLPAWLKKYAKEIDKEIEKIS